MAAQNHRIVFLRVPCSVGVCDEAVTVDREVQLHHRIAANGSVIDIDHLFEGADCRRWRVPEPMIAQLEGRVACLRCPAAVGNAVLVLSYLYASIAVQSLAW